MPLVVNCMVKIVRHQELDGKQKIKSHGRILGIEFVVMHLREARRLIDVISIGVHKLPRRFNCTAGE